MEDVWRLNSIYGAILRLLFAINVFPIIISWSPIPVRGSTLANYLRQIKSWHHRTPNHPVILITIDIKSKEGGYSNFHDEIDTYLKCHFDQNLIFSPNRLIKDHSLSLCENVIRNGWPLFSSGKLKHKFIFCLSGNSDWKSTYANTNLSARICFSDQDFSGADLSIRPLDKGNIVFFNFHIFHMHRGVWMNTIPRFAEKHLIVRTYVANSEENWRDCIQANASAIATDKINDHSWCKVSNEHPYRVKVPNYDKRLIK
ncbi:MAG: hypothetical protein IPJ40_20165, partial [Saprospirales bacterium]|nr:hypothetical protein [Saprospirales bacterium]